MRLDVPRPLQPFVQKTLIRKTLGTKDPALAKARFAPELAAAGQLLQGADRRRREARRLEAGDLVARWFELAASAVGGIDEAVDLAGMALVVRECEAARFLLWREEHPGAAWDFVQLIRSDTDLVGEAAFHAQYPELAPPVRTRDGRLFMPSEHGYPFLAGGRLSEFALRLKVYEFQSITLGLEKSALAEAILRAEAWSAVAPEVDLIVETFESGADETLWKQIAESYLRRVAGHVHATNPPKLREALGMAVSRAHPPSVSEVAPAVSKAPEVITTDARLTTVLEEWAAKKGPKIASEWRLAVRRWVEVHGDVPLPQITRRMVIDYRDLLSRLPGRVSKELSSLPIRDHSRSASAAILLISGSRRSIQTCSLLGLVSNMTTVYIFALMEPLPLQNGPMTHMMIGYARCSTDKQDLAPCRTASFR